MNTIEIDFTNTNEIKKLIHEFLVNELKTEKKTEVEISNIKILSRSSKSVRFTFESVVDGFPIPCDGSLELEANY
ncbi:hypothetical protein V6x_57030 [Gimesia chilikensis]|uniref:Uncharacterized protein n=1 Tax=Gimesia chilikensis TaxID=2605989 RepID=A0A517WL23_9PLAN|nr:hypothetical protein [Gimesia chilikensis]QDU05959.1 hypothetical protein V6x_57030 [Gimesia chilikensis]